MQNEVKKTPQYYSELCYVHHIIIIIIIIKTTSKTQLIDKQNTKALAHVLD